MLLIRFADAEGCDIAAKPAELRAVSESILLLASAGHGSDSFSGDVSASPEPYDRTLSRLSVRVSSGPVCATVDDDILSIEAAPEFLVSFASFFDFDDDTPSGHHHHHEYWEGNKDISPNSIPLVIGVIAATRFYVTAPNPRPDFRLVIAFLWRDGQNVDTEGDCDHPASHDWTELYVANREEPAEPPVDVSSDGQSPLVLVVKSESEYLAARVAYFLAMTTGGDVSPRYDCDFGPGGANFFL